MSRESQPLLANSSPNEYSTNVVISEVTAETLAQKDLKIDKEIVYEFGGSVGVSFMIPFFPILMYYLWISVACYDGQIFGPKGLEDFFPFFKRFWGNLVETQTVSPKLEHFVVYWGFLLFEAVLYVVMPGPITQGLPVPSLGFKKLDYKCSGLWAWYCTLVVSVILHITGLFPLTYIVDNFGPLMTVSIIAGFLISIIMYVTPFITKNTHRLSGNHIYDFFMGASLNPRIGILDLKMYAEIRIPWILLFYISLSAALKRYEEIGYVPAQLWFMVLAHFLYSNACQKGEEMIPITWDMFYEKWGFMIIYWNFSGVPFTYCLSSLYLLKTEKGRNLQMSPFYIGFIFFILIFAYYIWDTANSQKNRFRMQQVGTFVPRFTFPQLPWGTIKNPKYIPTPSGGGLLVSGWYSIIRKAHYTGDTLMALSWGLICGFGSFIPYFYVVFFSIMITHRAIRDMERCAKKYGDIWVEYCRVVPYIFIPYVF
ncbi:C-24(28) sterol reductase [Nowakowskiella sp. JEL0078]|nr:C-24(28) sterol reductase [Nowakowskiella sp. JEL0078]